MFKNSASKKDHPNVGAEMNMIESKPLIHHDAPSTTNHSEMINTFSYSWDVQLQTKSYQRKKHGSLHIEVRSTTTGKANKLFHFETGLSDNDIVIIDLVRKPRKKERMNIFNASEFRDDGSSSGDDESAASMTTTNTLNYGSIISQKSIPRLPLGHSRLEDVDLINLKKKQCQIVFHKSNGDRKLRLFFSSEHEIHSFSKTFEYLKMAIKNRAHKSMLVSNLQGGIENAKTYLLQIIAAYDLRCANRIQAGSDPYCVVRIANEIHRTKVINNTTQPIWTFSTGSLTLFSATSEELFTYGLTFEIYDWERVMKHQSLGRVNVSIQTLLKNANKRIELDLETECSYKNLQSKLVIRFREATEKDKKFIQRKKDYFYDEAKKHAMERPRDFSNPTSANLFSTKLSRKKQDKTGQTLYRISPYPDPERVRETTWMSQEAIENDSLKPSISWIQAGNGGLGYLFVEIIGCDDLVDKKHLISMDKIDPFVTLVYEDTSVTSEIVYNCVSPRFMPWTRRAFVFNITYNTSLLYLAVHDYNHSGSDDQAGRLTVSLNNFRPNTEYLLYYNLNQSARYFPRGVRGTIKLRLSVQWHDQRNVFYNVFHSYHHRFHVNVDSSKKMQRALFAVRGDPDMHEYSSAIIESLLEELYSYFNDLLDIPGGIMSVILWRNSHNITIFKTHNLSIPLRSIILFLGGVLFVERPQLVPSLLMGSLGWIMIIMLENQRKRASPWHRPRSYQELLQIFLFGKLPLISIEPVTETLIDLNCYKEIKEKSIKTATEERLEQIASKLQMITEFNELNGLEYFSEDLTTKDESLTLVPPNLLKYILWPWQQLLETICGQIRYILRVIKWEKSFVSFWITTICFFSSFVFIFVPWNFVMKWTGRLFVWVFLGPWMKMVDKCIQKQLSSKESSILKAKRLEVRKNIEKSTALKDYKNYLFGKFILSMPHHMEPDRYIDKPLAISSARPFSNGKMMSNEIRTPKHILGGKLNVDIIPSSSYLEPDIEIENKPPRGLKAFRGSGKSKFFIQNT